MACCCQSQRSQCSVRLSQRLQSIWDLAARTEQIHSSISTISCCARSWMHQVAPAGLDHSPQPESIIMPRQSIQQPLPGPMPGLQAPPAAPAPELKVGFRHHPQTTCTAAGLSAPAGSVAAAPLLQQTQMCRCMSKRWHSLSAPWTWHAMSLPCPGACKLGSE